METYSKTSSSYPVEVYKEFVLLARSGISRPQILSRLKEKYPKLTRGHIQNWLVRFTPDLVPHDLQLKYQKIYSDYKRTGIDKQQYARKNNISCNTLIQAMNFCDPKEMPWLEEFEKENGFSRKPISMIAEPLDDHTTVEMIDSLMGPELPLPASVNRTENNQPPEVPSSPDRNMRRAELCLGELKISWESPDIESSLCKIIMNLTGEFSL